MMLLNKKKLLYHRACEEYLSQNIISKPKKRFFKTRKKKGWFINMTGSLKICFFVATVFNTMENYWVFEQKEICNLKRTISKKNLAVG